MRFAAAISEDPLAVSAVGEVVGEVLERLGPGADILMVFATRSHLGALEDIAPALRTLLAPKVMVGCIADGVVGPEREVHGSPGLAVWAASGCDAVAVHLPMADNQASQGLAGALRPGDTVVLLADPFSYAPELLFAHLNQTEICPAVIGGFAAMPSSFAPGSLILDGTVIEGGAVAAILRPEAGDIELAVAQGSRPIGTPLVVTRADGRVIYELAGASALGRLTEIWKSDLGEEDMALVSEGLLLGRVIDEHQDSFGIGDFVVRTLVASDPASGSFTVSDDFEVGAIVQFHVRDGQAANVALTKSLLGKPTQAALMFTSTSRGYDMFDVPSHDAVAAAELLGNPPLAGLMTSGEFAPVAGKNVVNSLSAALALFTF